MMSKPEADSLILRDFERLFEENFDQVRNYLARRVGAGEADNLAEDVFTIALRRHASYDPTVGSARGWLFGIAHNVLRHHRRDEQRRLKQLSAAARTVSLDAEPFEGVEARIDAAKLRRVLAVALSELPRGQRDVLLLTAWSDLSAAEISQTLGIRPGTVRSRLSRARARVWERLAISGEVVDGSAPQVKETT